MKIDSEKLIKILEELNEYAIEMITKKRDDKYIGRSEAYSIILDILEDWDDNEEYQKGKYLGL